MTGRVAQLRLHTIPVTLGEAKAFVGLEHRHHAPSVSHRWSLGVADETGKVRGVAMCGRPVGRWERQHLILEATRVATDGCPNACSHLYGAIARSAVAMGYQRHNVITYTLASEPGTSLIAAGWVRDADIDGRSWNCASRPREDVAPTEDKVRWRAAEVPS